MKIYNKYEIKKQIDSINNRIHGPEHKNDREKNIIIVAKEKKELRLLNIELMLAILQERFSKEGKASEGENNPWRF